MRYTVVLVPGDEPGRYVAYVPVIPGCVTQGDSIEEALTMAHDAASLLVETFVADGDDVLVETGVAIVAAIDVAVPEPAGAAA